MWARAVLNAAALLLVVTDGLLTQVGEWTDGEDPEGQKLAFTASAIDLPDTVVAQGTADPVVSWHDGVVRPVAVLGPQVALDQARAGSVPQPSDVPLVVTAVTATTVRVGTAQGEATAPAWDLALAHTPVHVVVLAAAVVSTGATPVSDPASATELRVWLVPLDGAGVGTDGRTLTARFTGASDPGSQPCGEDYTAFAVTTDRAIVLVVVRHPYTGPTASSNDEVIACNASGAFRQATVVLDAPWAGRTVLDLFTAQPVPTST